MIVAADEKDLIGRGNELPWYLREDLQRFKRVTTGHVLVAGRRTHESILARAGRTLPGRFTVVVSRGSHPAVEGAVFVPDIASALRVATDVSSFAGRDEVFVIGGAEVYAQSLDRISKVYLTRVHLVAAGEVRLRDGWLDGFDLTSSVDRRDFSFETYERACTT